MICPVRCVTCGFVLANKYRFFEREKEKLFGKEEPIIDVDGDFKGYREIFEMLQIERMCCRRHLLGHRDLIKII
jgi:DNA-directed RNA polymerase I, II, and III subunit RPABC5